MAITDEEFQDFLSDPNSKRCILVEYEFKSGDSYDTGYVANMPFVSFPEDTPPNQPYYDLLVGDITFNRSTSPHFDGGYSSSLGEITILINEDTLLLTNYATTITGVSVLIGSPDWIKDDFRVVVKGSVKATQIKKNRIYITIRDQSESINIPFPRTYLSAGPSEGQVIPLCFGICYNVTPLLVDDATHKYQVHDGKIEDVIDVRDNGVSVSYTVDVNTGTFTLSASPSGQITADVHGAKPATGDLLGFYTFPSGIVKLILYNYASEIVIDSDSFNHFGTEYPYNSGIYITDANETILSVCQRLLKSVGIFMFFDKVGACNLGQLSIYAPNTGYIYNDEIVLDGLQIKEIIEPEYSVNLQYRKNWTVQNNLAGAVSEADRSLYSQPYSSVYLTNGSLFSNYPNALAGPVVESLLVEKADCEVEAARRLAAASQKKIIYEVQTFTTVLGFNLGDALTIDYTSDLFYDQINNVPCYLVSSAERIGNSKSVIEVMVCRTLEY